VEEGFNSIPVRRGEEGEDGGLYLRDFGGSEGGDKSIGKGEESFPLCGRERVREGFGEVGEGHCGLSAEAISRAGMWYLCGFGR